jgi:hypothetical protein
MAVTKKRTNDGYPIAPAWIKHARAAGSRHLTPAIDLLIIIYANVASISMAN